MAFPAIRNLKNLMGDASLTVACPSKLTTLWERCGFVDRVLTLEKPRQLYACSSVLRRGKFETALLLTNSLRSAMEARMAGINTLVGHSANARRLLLTRAVPRKPFDWNRTHRMYDYLDLSEALGATQDTSFPLIRLPHAPKVVKQIAICPGAEYGPTKRWLPWHFVEVGRTLQLETGASIVLLGSSGDKPAVDAVAEGLPGAENLCGKTDLNEFMNRLAQSLLVICNDSGAMHLASALGTPVVAIFGSTEPRLTAPLGKRFAAVRRHVACSPCFLRRCPFDFSCMTQVTPDEVLAAARKMLG